MGSQTKLLKNSPKPEFNAKDLVLIPLYSLQVETPKKGKGSYKRKKIKREEHD